MKGLIARCVTGLLLICAVTLAQSARAAHPPADVDGRRLEAADREPQNWMSTGRNYAEDRFSSLRQINASNVGKLGLAWYFETDSTIGTEATPLVVDGVMYTTSVWNRLHALDARTGKELWRYDPKVNRSWMRYMCCGPSNRGPAVWKGRVYFATIDGRLIAGRGERQACLVGADDRPVEAVFHHRRAAHRARQGHHRQCGR